MSVYGYCRVSTDRQANEGESLGVQERQLQGYVQMQGMTLDRVFVERGVSGSIPLADRPEGAAMLAALQSGDVVVSPKLDRVFRSALDALQQTEALRARGVSLHLLDLGGDIAGNGLSRLFMTIAAAFAELERDRIRERITQVKRDQKARGRFLGGTRPPFGFRAGADGGLVLDETEQAAIARAKRMRGRGKSLRYIAAKLALDGHRLNPESVRRMLARSARASESSTMSRQGSYPAQPYPLNVSTS
jgi:DNA invertase Pin-like site-specific DNA recombinase